MTSYFRRGIAKKVLATLNEIVGCSTDQQSECLLSTAFKVNRFGRDLPQLLLPWNKFLNLKPELSETFRPRLLISALKNQGLPSPEGINDIATSDQLPSGIAFTLDRGLFTKVVLSDICVNIDAISRKSCLFHKVSPQNITVMYSTPKMGALFHMGHFRPAIYANFLANIQEYVGHKVTRCCFVEDWGFNCGLLVPGFQDFGSEDELEKNPSRHLYEVLKASTVKYETDQDFRKTVTSCLQSMKEGNEKVLFQWKRLRDPFMKHLKDMYKELGIEFNETHMDSTYSEQIADIMSNIEKQELFVFHEKESNVELSFSSERISKNSSFVAKAVEPFMYSLARNIAVAEDVKNKYDFDAMFFTSDASTSKIVSATVEIMEALGFDWHKDINNVRVKDITEFDASKSILIHDALRSAKMNILRKMKSGALPNVEENDLNQNADDVAASIGIASLLVNDMKYRKNHAYEFNWDEAMMGKKYSGITLQLCHAALTRIKEEAKLDVKIDADTSSLTEPAAFQLVRHLGRFDEIIFKAYTYTEPALILQYLFTLCILVEKAANVLSLEMKGNGPFKVRARLLLFHAAQKVLGKGLTLLGIKPVERI